jgi:monofunctional biosynthetic peptidoglycan transglycosylase
MNNFSRIPLRIASHLWIPIKTLFLVYAVIFSIAGTVGLFLGYHFATTPIRQVKFLRKHNPVETSYMIRYRATLCPNDTLRQIFVPLDSISPNLRDAVLAAEDDGFYTHPGFDIETMLSALEYNRTAGGIKRGGSTITQQLAKNLFLTNVKTFERKFRELGYTLLLEKYLGKKRILELYLNYAQWGKTLFGCEAASRHYFKKSCRNLSRGEAARLAAILSMPLRASPLNTGSLFIGQRIAVIANNLYLHRQIDDSDYTRLTGTPPPGKGSSAVEDSASDDDDDGMR